MELSALRLCFACLSVALFFALFFALPSPARADEAAVRRAVESLVQAWNRHDAKAWSEQLASDVWYTETDDSVYQRFKGRDKARELFAYSVENSDLQWQIERMKTRPDGVVSVVLAQRVSMLPKSGGTYQAEFISEPALARWRRDGDGRWRLFFFTSHKGWATAEIRKDEEAPSQAKDAASRPPGNAPLPSAPAVAIAGARVASGTEPPAYSTQFGERSESCFHCHGRRPTVSEDGDRDASSPAARRRTTLRRCAVPWSRHGRAASWTVCSPTRR